MDESLTEAISNLRDIIHALPTSIGEIFRPFATALNVVAPPSSSLGSKRNAQRSVVSQSNLFGVQVNFGDFKRSAEGLTKLFTSVDFSRIRFPKNPLSSFSINTSTLQSGFDDLDRQTVSLTRDFAHLGEMIRSLRFPKFNSPTNFGGNAANFAKTVRDFIQPMLVRPLVGTVLNLAPIKAGLGSVFKAVLSSIPALSPPQMKQIPYKPGVTVLVPHHFYGSGSNSASSFPAMAANFFANTRGVFATIPPLLVSAFRKGAGAATAVTGGVGGIGGVLGGLGMIARFAAIPGAFLAVTGQIENLREQALAANAHNTRFADYSGAIFREQMMVNYGNYYRQRSIAKATEGSAVELAQNVNQMEQAFLPFDIMKTDLGNKVGSVKAGIAKGFADTLLTPIANMYNSPMWDHFRKSVKGGETTGILGALGVIGTGAAAGFAFGGPVGAVIGGGLAAAGLGVFLDPMKGGSVLGGALAGGLALGSIFALAGSVIPGVGTVLGGAVGFGLGAIGGGIMAELKPDEATLVHRGEWYNFLKDANARRPLRPLMNIPPPRAWAPVR